MQPAAGKTQVHPVHVLTHEHVPTLVPTRHVWVPVSTGTVVHTLDVSAARIQRAYRSVVYEDTAAALRCALLRSLLCSSTAVEYSPLRYVAMSSALASVAGTPPTGGVVYTDGWRRTRQPLLGFAALGGSLPGTPFTGGATYTDGWRRSRQPLLDFGALGGSENVALALVLDLEGGGFFFVAVFAFVFGFGFGGGAGALLSRLISFSRRSALAFALSSASLSFCADARPGREGGVAGVRSPPAIPKPSYSQGFIVM